MIREAMLLPILYILSQVVRFVGWIGGLANPNPLFSRLFDWVIGFERAHQMRDEHAEELVDAVAAREIEYDVSKQVLIEETREQHQKSVSRISRGESVLSLSIAFLAVLMKELPANLQLPCGLPSHLHRLCGLAIPLPSLNVVLLVLTAILVVSVFFRQTAIEAHAFTSPSVFDTYDGLMTKLAWNGAILGQTKLAFNMVALQIMREFDDRIYQMVLDLMAEHVEHDGIDRREAMETYGSEVFEILTEKWDIDNS
jgi:hypothetical protein